MDGSDDRAAAAEDFDGIGDLVRYAAGFPRSRGYGFLLKGGLLVLSMLLILPIFMFYGYMMRVVSAAARSEELPVLGGWGGLFMDGVRLIVVMLPVVIVSYVVALLPLLAGDPAAAEWSLFSNLGSIVVSYVGLPVFLTYAVTRDWHTAYDYQHISGIVTQVAYLRYFLFYFVLSIAAVVVGGVLMLLSFLTIVGWIIIIPAILFAIQTGLMAYWGQVYKDLG